MKIKKFISALLIGTTVGVLIDLFFKDPDFNLKHSIVEWFIFSLIFYGIMVLVDKMNHEELKEAEEINRNQD